MKERRLSKKKNQQILATLAMGINLVNSMIPLAAALRELPNKSDLQVQQPKREVKTLEYTVLPHTLNFVENMVFGKAEAADYSVDFGVSSGVASMSSGDIMVIKGGTGTVDTMSGGVQYISKGGTGTVSALNGGSQNIYKEGIGAVETVISGYQNIWNGGTGTVNTMSGGQQFISRGSGIVYTMSGGMQNIFSGGTGIVITMNDGSQAIRNSGFGTVSALNGGTQQIYAGGTALDTNIYGGTQLIGGSAVNTTIDGGVAVMLDGNAFVSGLTMSGGEYMLGADGGDYNILGQFEFTGGRLDMTQNKNGTQTGTQEELTIENLDKAGGTFIMDTDLNNEEGDKITIKEAANVGTSYIQVNDTSLLNGTVTDHKNLLLVTDNSGKLTFEGKDLNNGGIWTFTPEIENGLNVKDNAGNVIGSKEEWYLTHIDRSVNNDTQVLLDGSDSSYAMWRNTNDTLRKHLGDLHYRTNKKGVEGIWAHYTGGKFGGSGFDSSYNMYQLGYDKAANAKSIYGFAVENGSGHTSYSYGSGKDKLFAGSIYGTWHGDNSSYTDVVARFGQFDTDIRSYGDYPDKAKAKSRAYSLSVEYGKTIELNKAQGTFIEPQAQLIIGRLGSSSYTTDRGNNVYMGGVNSCIGRLGVVAGKKDASGNDVYLKVNMLHEFGGNRDVRMLAGNGETLSESHDYGDTWFELGLGGNIKLGNSSHLYGDIERSFGADIQKKWQVNAGVRFEF